MSNSLQTVRVKDGYGNLLQIFNSNNGIDSTPRPVRDGKGDASALSVSTNIVRVDGTLETIIDGVTHDTGAEAAAALPDTNAAFTARFKLWMASLPTTPTTVGEPYNMGGIPAIAQ